MSDICCCDKESSIASIVPIVFTVVSVEGATSLPLFRFGDAEARPYMNCWCQWKMVLRVSVCSPYTSFIAAYVYVGFFFNIWSWKHTCTVHHTEATDAQCTAQVWTYAQVVWRGTICLSAVRDSIHRLSVHQNKAATRFIGCWSIKTRQHSTHLDRCVICRSVRNNLHS